MDKHRWIRDDIQLDFSLPKSMMYLIEEMEKFDEIGSHAYFNYADALDDGAKELFRRGTLSKKQWDLLSQKYLYVED